MIFIETFSAVFTATITGQIIIWWFKKEIEHRLDKHYDKLKEKLINRKEAIIMGKIAIDIEYASNKSFIVTWYKNQPNALQKLGGSKVEKEQLAFTTARELVVWIEKVC